MQFLDNIKDSANILIVDDKHANIFLLEALLKNSGYKNVSSTQESTKVTELCNNITFDLILLDYNMPILDGFGVMKNLKESLNLNMPPIIMLTAQYAKDIRLKILNMGARDFITKPFDVHELLMRINNTLDVHFAHLYMKEQNKILEKKVEERTAEIFKNQLDVVRCLGVASEYRDEETGLHILRMSKISVIIATALGVSDKDCELLLQASPMHDVGKIGIPDHILLKPGKFNEEEWKIMQSHALIGASILQNANSELMKMAHDIALTHHEKWNGRGYPNSLKGDNIPLVGRITAIADVFDALTSERPYKKAWLVEDAVNLIKTEKGEHFDPKVVDAFLNCLPDITKIIKEYKEPVH